MTRTRPRGKCRSCGRPSAITQDGLVQGHLKGDSRCPGRARPPAGEEPCSFGCGSMVGRVSYPADLASADLTRAHASTYVCADPDHHAEAAAWVQAKTGQAGVFTAYKRAVAV